MNWMKNLPNQLTVSRIILIGVFVLLANIDASKINFVYIKNGRFFIRCFVSLFYFSYIEF